MAAAFFVDHLETIRNEGAARHLTTLDDAVREKRHKLEQAQRELELAINTRNRFAESSSNTEAAIKYMDWAIAHSATFDNFTMVFKELAMKYRFPEFEKNAEREKIASWVVGGEKIMACRALRGAIFNAVAAKCFPPQGQSPADLDQWLEFIRLSQYGGPADNGLCLLHGCENDFTGSKGSKLCLYIKTGLWGPDVIVSRPREIVMIPALRYLKVMPLSHYLEAVDALNILEHLQRYGIVLPDPPFTYKDGSVMTSGQLVTAMARGSV